MATVIVSTDFYARHDGLISFEGVARHGKGKREFSMVVDLETLEKIVDAVRKVPGTPIGHALWHLKNDKPVPCSSCVRPATDEEQIQALEELEPR